MDHPRIQGGERFSEEIRLLLVVTFEANAITRLQDGGKEGADIR